MTTVAIASWLLTYLIHSTVLLGVVWLVSRTLADHHLGVQETLLRTALIGGVITASLQMCLGFEPLAGAFAINALERPQATISALTEASGFGFTADDPVVTTGAGLAATKNVIDGWAGVLLTAWGAGSLLAFLVLGRSMFDLRRLLQTRRFRPAGRLIERLAAAMGLDRRVLLSTSKAIAVPFATGVRRPEICCPDRVRDLAIEHQTGLFAHELAHLARRDPAWQLIYRVGEAILFLQPLNRLVRRRLEEIAEHLTDERAAACTGDRLGLARCLVVIAHWGSSSRLGVPATTLAQGPRLGQRVRRLLNGGPTTTEKPVWVVPMVVCILSAAALTLPLVASTPADAETTATKTGLASAKTWSEVEDAPPGTPAPPDQPAPADATAASPHLRPPSPNAAPAPASVNSLRAPSAGSSKPAPASAPSPSAAPSPRSDAEPPSPSAAPAPPRETEEPNDTQDADSTAEREREKTQQEAEDRRRSTEKERARAEARAKESAGQAEELAREHEERARQRAAEVAQRHRLTEDKREELRRRADELRTVAEARAREMERTSEELRRRADEMRTVAEARAREMERTSEERARAAEERAKRLAERAEERAERLAAQRDELRRQALDEKPEKDD